MRKPKTRNQKMKNETKTTIPYVVQGFEVLRNDNTDVLNKRIQSRYTTEIPLAPSFDPRPVQTKYTRFGVQDEYRPTSVPIEQDMYPEWESLQTNQYKSPFTVPTKNGPPLAYYMNLDKETALQRQSFYSFMDEKVLYNPVPDKGDLYTNHQAKYSGYGGSGEKNPVESSPYLFDQSKYQTTGSRRIPNERFTFNNPTQARNTQN